MKRWRAVLFCVLVAVGVARLSVLALSVGPNVDEETGIAEAIDYSLAELLLTGPEAELNTSPLHYIVDKAWIASWGGAPHRHFNLDLFFRFLPILFYSLCSGLAFLLALRLCELFSFAGKPALFFSLSAGIFFQTNFVLIRGAALQDRPYALWMFLSTLQLFLLLRAPTRPSKRLAALGLLLAMNSFASVVQGLAAALCRMRGRSSWPILAEALPALGVGFWYWSRSRGMFADLTSIQEFAGMWLNAASFAFWGRGDSLFQFGGLSVSWQNYNAIAFALTFVAIIFVALWKTNPARTLAIYITLLLLAALPLTLLAWKVAHSIQPRYFFFLYPALGVAHFLTVLFLAKEAGKHRPAAASAVLIAWAMLLTGYRLPSMGANFVEAIRTPWRFPLYQANRSEACPDSFGSFRMQVKGGIDLTRTQEHCLLGKRSEPALNPTLGPIMPSSKTGRL